ncbi:T6SS amidase immunity protein Tai4 family protein [Burkholderia sp. IDO3]|nr:T6SS amidase immunity protein Tai4 family protein [Burkholderia sp. IDO3]
MVLAQCLATAYEQAPAVSKDIGSSTNALRDWTYYDLEHVLEVLEVGP